jgi:hypothetical protein
MTKIDLSLDDIEVIRLIVRQEVNNQTKSLPDATNTVVKPTEQYKQFPPGTQVYFEHNWGTKPYKRTYGVVCADRPINEYRPDALWVWWEADEKHAKFHTNWINIDSVFVVGGGVS